MCLGQKISFPNVSDFLHNSKSILEKLNENILVQVHFKIQTDSNCLEHFRNDTPISIKNIFKCSHIFYIV